MERRQPQVDASRVLILSGEIRLVAVGTGVFFARPTVQAKDSGFPITCSAGLAMSLHIALALQWDLARIAEAGIAANRGWLREST
jgi:hypothetical protein